MAPRLTPDARAALLDAALTEDERYSLLHSQWAIGFLPDAPLPDGAIPAAGYVPPIPRLGIPGLYETDASLGVTNPRNARPGDTATALPSGLAMASTWDAGLAHDAGAMIGDEAAKKGFNVLLGGGMNLVRDPRCGRNFEYLGEDPLLAGVLSGEAIRGTQSQGIIATAKHFVLNDQETGRHVVNAVIDEAALRESDLLAFQIAIERGAPGAIILSRSVAALM
jgi:beta-glucosidase